MIFHGVDLVVVWLGGLLTGVTGCLLVLKIFFNRTLATLWQDRCLERAARKYEQLRLLAMKGELETCRIPAGVQREKRSSIGNLVIRLIFWSVGWLILAFAAFALLVRGYTESLREVYGETMLLHSTNYCPNWLLGLVTGAFMTGIVWWLLASARR